LEQQQKKNLSACRGEGSLVGPLLLAARALPLRCAAVLYEVLHWLIAVRKAILLSDPRTLFISFHHFKYEVRSSSTALFAFRTAVTTLVSSRAS
jgi:hypothetical protein